MIVNSTHQTSRDKIKTTKKVVLNIIFIVLILLLSVPPSAFCYKTKVHKQITHHAVVEKSFLDTYLREIGFKEGVEYKINTWGKWSIKDWIKYGSAWEDNITFRVRWRFPLDDKRGILYCHFYDPLFDRGYYKLEEKGESLIHRMNDYVETGQFGWLDHNEWSYQMARDLFYAALTGDSTQHEYWYMMDRPLEPYTYLDGFEGKKKMNHEEREQFFAWTLQALGHLLHLIQE